MPSYIVEKIAKISDWDGSVCSQFPVINLGSESNISTFSLSIDNNGSIFIGTHEAVNVTGSAWFFGNSVFY